MIATSAARAEQAWHACCDGTHETMHISSETLPVAAVLAHWGARSLADLCRLKLDASRMH